MNLLTILLGFFAWQSFSGKNKKNNQNQSPLGNLGNLGDLGSLFSNPESFGLIAAVAKLIDKKSSDDDKSSAIMELVSNPAIFEVAKKFLFKQKPEPQTEPTFSNESKEAFKPLETIAGVEVSQKLYHLYDNWYIKK